MPHYRRADILSAAAKKARVGVDELTGIISCKRKPLKSRFGLYLRVSLSGHNPVSWAYWTGTAWGLYSVTRRGAVRKRNKLSTQQLAWIGLKEDHDTRHRRCHR